jgi:hypothetical protein
MQTKPLLNIPAEEQAGDLSFVDSAPVVAAAATNIAPAPASELNVPKQTSVIDSITESAFELNIEANLYEATRRALRDDPDADPNFNPWEYARASLDKPEYRRAVPEMFDRLQGIRSQAAFDRMVTDVNTEMAAEERMYANGVLPMLAGGILGTLASPTTWITAGTVSTVMSAAKIAQGATRGAAISRGAIQGFAEAIPLDAASRASHYTYDNLDTLENLGFSAIAGGVIGRLLHTDVPGSPFSKEGKGWKSAETSGETADYPAYGDLSAAAVRGDRPAANGTMAAFDFATPTGRTIRRAAESEKDFALHTRLYESPVSTVGNQAGVSTEASAELISRVMFESRFFSSQQEVMDIYRQMSLDAFGEGSLTGNVKNMFGMSNGRVTMDDFTALVEDYRRAGMAIEDAGKDIAAARALLDNPHANPKVAAAIKQAATARDRFYKQFADDLVNHGLMDKEFLVIRPDGKKPKAFRSSEEAQDWITKQKEKTPEAEYSVVESVPDLRQTYTPIILDRRAIEHNMDGFREFLRDVFKANPPPEFLASRYGVTNLKELTPVDREIAVADWVISQKDGFEKAAEAAVKKANKELGVTLYDLLKVRKQAKEVDRRTSRTEVERSRLVERELRTEWDAKNAAREDARQEAKALKTAWDLAQARKLARGKVQAEVQAAPDVGSKELAALERATPLKEKAVARAERTALDALSDPFTPPGRAQDAGDVVKANRAAENAVIREFDAKVKAKVDPLEAPKGPEGNFDRFKIGELTERLKTSNQRLAQLDKEIDGLAEDLTKVRTQRANAEARLSHLNEVRKDLAKYARILRSELPKATNRAKRAVSNLNKTASGEFKTSEELIDRIIDDIVRGKDIPRAVLEETVGESGRLRQRELFVGEALLDPRLSKFIERNGDRLAEAYGRDISPRIAFRKAFGNDVDDDLKSVVQELESEWQEKINAATNPKQKEKLIAKKKESLEDFKAMRDKLLNKYGRPDDPESALMFLNRNVRRLNVARLMGLSLLSSFTDLATGVFSTGRTFEWIPRMAKSATKFASQMKDNELAALLVGSEQARYHAMASRRLMPEENPWQARGGIGTGAVRTATEAVDNGADFLARSTMVLSGQGGWTAKLKFVFGTLQIDNMTRDLPRWSSLDAKGRAQFARVGIDEQWAKRISDQIQKHSQDIDGIKVPNGKEWTDREAYMRFKTALTRAMDEAVIQPGIGDLPLFMSKPAGQLFLQFQSYAFASTNRYVRLAWQARDVNAMISLNMMLGLGTLGYVAREFVKGDNDKGETPSERLEKNKTADWIYEGITRSALPGVWSYGIDAFRKIGQKPIQDALGVEVFGNNPSRLASESAFTNVFGPTLGLLENASAFSSAMANAPNDGWDKVASTGQRLAPWGNLLPFLALHSASEAALSR